MAKENFVIQLNSLHCRRQENTQTYGSMEVKKPEIQGLYKNASKDWWKNSESAAVRGGHAAHSQLCCCKRYCFHLAKMEHGFSFQIITIQNF
jgi:hypothetical protein